MAARCVMHAAVVACRIIKPDPTGEMLHRLCARPVRIVLMPSDNPAVMRRLGKNLVVPETNGAAQQLRGGNEKSRVPKQVVEAGCDAPRPQGMKQDPRRIG